MRWRRFLLGGIVGFALALALNLAPYIWTYRAYQTDGYEVAGFPLLFHRVGGLAGTTQFFASALVTDIAFGLLLAVLAGWTALKLPQSTRGFPLDSTQ